eukprot:2482356-Amphidinium_carterae.1
MLVITQLGGNPLHLCAEWLRAHTHIAFAIVHVDRSPCSRGRDDIQWYTLVTITAIQKDRRNGLRTWPIALSRASSMASARAPEKSKEEKNTGTESPCCVWHTAYKWAATRPLITQNTQRDLRRPEALLP